MASDDVVVGLEEFVNVSDQVRWRFGTAGSFPILFREAWREDEHVFSVEGGKAPNGDSNLQHLGTPERVSGEVLNRYPVDVLAIEEPSSVANKATPPYWTKWLDKCKDANLPDYVIISAPSKELVEDSGLQSKPWRRRFEKWGYEAHYWFIRAHEHGGVVRQDRCMLVLRRKDVTVPKVILPEPIVTDEAPRIARNMLSPMGVPRTAWLQDEWVQKEDYPEWVTAAAAPCIIVGETRQRSTPVFSADGSLPDSVGALIATDKGVRRLLPEELAKAKGVPKSWTTQEILSTREVNRMTSLHLWAAVAASLDNTTAQETTTESVPAIPLLDEPIWTVPNEEGPEWEWKAPDLSPGGEWHTARVSSLQAAVRGLPDADEHLAKGLAALDTHRKNYEGEGSIHKLQLLWWEFPPEHWEELRNGCAMNFLAEPRTGITENAPMTEEQVEIAAEFIDELWHIGVFGLIPDDCEMKANAPLFAVSKAGQPGQWRIIADMKSGGQNEFIGKDPTHLP